jgi:SPP1 family predicted phage head-tail adaptor
MTFDELTAGDLNRIVVIQSKTIKSDSTTEGAPVEVWGPFLTCFAAVIPMSAKEIYTSGATNNEGSTIFRLRYHPTIDTTMRISYLNNIYNIIDVSDINGRHVESQILTNQAVTNG